MKPLYDFGPYRLDTAERRLLRDGHPIALEAKAFDLLLILIENRGRLVKKKDLMGEIWPDAAVEETNLTRNISVLRKALGEANPNVQYIETVSRYGYRFVAEVKPVSEKTAPVTPQPAAPMPAGAPATGADPHHPPYVGLHSFSEYRSTDFFGRDTEVRELVELLSHLEKRVILLHSPSGAGKTSLINAVLRQELFKAGYQVLPTARVGYPARSARPGQNPYTFAAIVSMGDEPELIQSAEAITWATYLSAKSGSKPPQVLVLDQFEEIITIDPDRLQIPAADQLRRQREFFGEIQEALKQNSLLHVILAFREEYLPALQRLGKELSGYWAPYSLFMLRRSDAKAAIRNPALHQGVRFESDEVLESLVRNLCDNSGEFVEPLPLQLTCVNLWRKLSLHQRMITWKDFRQATADAEDSADQDEQTVSRFVKSVLHDFCAQAVQSASASPKDQSGHCFPEALIDLGCRQFVSEHRSRTWVRRGEAWTGDLPTAIVDEMVTRHLLRLEQHRKEGWYELAHDTLIQPVLDRARRIDDDRLWEIFSGALREIVATERARREGIEESVLARQCCLAFVAEDGRLKALHGLLEAASGRLPLWIIEDLVRRHILRKTARQEQDEYELIHWRMARAIHGKLFPAIERFYRTHRRLETFLEESRAAGVATAIWSQKLDKVMGILGDVEEVIGSANLSEVEASFVLRASLASGYHLTDLTLQLGKSFPIATAEILKEATQYKPKPDVRRNAARALGVFPLDDREAILRRLALDDPDESVQKAAASTLAGFESLDSAEWLFARLDDPAVRASALRVLAWMYDAMPDASLRQFEQRRKQLSRSSKVRLRAWLTSLRWQGARSRIFIALTIAMISTILVTVPPRALLATFGLTITQLARTPIGFFEGAFHGIAGAISWSLFIGGSLLAWWFVGEGRRPWRGRAAALIGAMGGLAGGIVNTFALVLVYGRDSLSKMKWLLTPDSSLLDVVTSSGLAFAMPVYGALIGLGVGEATRRMLPWWQKFVADVEQNSLHSDVEQRSRRSEIQRVFDGTSAQLLLNIWLLILPMLTAAVAVRTLLAQMPQPSADFSQLLGEAISLFFGGIGCVIGLFLGLHILRKGLHIPGREE